MKADYSDDPVLHDYLEESKMNLIAYYKENYAAEETLTPTSSQMITPSQQNVSGSPQKCFTSCYRIKSKAFINELEEYWKLPIEDFETCNLIQCGWAVGCSFLNCLSLHATFCAFQVGTLILDTVENIDLLIRICGGHREGLLWWKGHDFFMLC